MEDDFDAFIGGVEALLARTTKNSQERAVALKELNNGVVDLERKTERLLNEGMRVIGRQHRAQARRIDQFSRSVDQQVREEAQQEAEWAREDAAETTHRK